MTTQAQSLPSSSPEQTPTSVGFRAALGRLMRGRSTLDDLWLLLPAMLFFMALSISVIRPNDFWWHLRTGQIIVETRTIPMTDLFSFTRAGQPWTNEGWLMQVLLYLLYYCGGLPLIIFCHALTITAGYVLLHGACLCSSGGRTRAAALATLAAGALGMASWGVRPQSISFLLFAILLVVLQRHALEPPTGSGPGGGSPAGGSHALWLLPLLFALWVNLHGAFVFGIGLLGIYVLVHVGHDLAAGRALRRETRDAMIVGLASLAALSLHPSGPLAILRYVGGFFQSEVTHQANLEFLPLSIREGDGLLFFAFVVVFILLAFQRRASLPASALPAMLVFGIASLYARRVLPWFAMIAAPAFAQVLAINAGPRTSPPARASRLNGVLLGLLALLTVATLPWLRPYLPLPADRQGYIAPSETPVEATGFLCSMGSNVRVYNDLAFGSYLIWACPSVPVFIDTRIELYPQEMWRDYFWVANAITGWEDVLQRYGVNTVIAHKRGMETLVAGLRASARWEAMYEDSTAAIFRQR